MRIDNMIQSFRVLTRADAMIAEATFKARLSQIALHAAAFFICIFGLVMAGIAVAMICLIPFVPTRIFPPRAVA